MSEAIMPKPLGPSCSVGTNSIRNYLNTIDNSWEFLLFKIMMQYPIGDNYFNTI